MNKRMLVLVLLPLLVIALAGVSQGGQGRMGGMGDPYGLVMDESDFLIHPAKIATGEGIRFYGNYRFTYTDVMDWDYNFTRAATTYSFDMSGDEWRHDALVGAAFPLGPGRMGLFFNYEGRRGDFEGDGVNNGVNILGAELTDDLDAFALRLVYGIPVGGFNLGGEVGFAYRQEEKELFGYYADMSFGFVNDHIINTNLVLYLPPVVPYESAYWEIPFKAGVEGIVGPVDLEFTLRGGIIVSGDNTLAVENQAPVGVVTSTLDMDGDVAGWRIGGDLWLRYPLADGLSLPFLVRVDYREKTRDGDGSPSYDPDIVYDYDHQETSLHLMVGGGLDKELSESTRIAVGIYYNYLHDNAEADFTLFDTGVLDEVIDYSGYPDLTEHRVMVRLAGEHVFTPAVALRVGLVGFFGWAQQDLDFWYSDNISLGRAVHELSADGSHWGIGASVGGTVKLQRITLEPFFNVGYQSLDLSGDGSHYYQFNAGGFSWFYPLERDDARNEWSIGGGFSVLFDL